MFDFHVTLPQANVKATKVPSNSCVKFTHSIEALTVDIYRYERKVNKIIRDV